LKAVDRSWDFVLDASNLLVNVVIAGVFGEVMLKLTIPLFPSAPAVVAPAQLWRTAAHYAGDRRIRSVP
jgi:hypothetical protein